MTADRKCPSAPVDVPDQPVAHRRVFIVGRQRADQRRTHELRCLPLQRRQQPRRQRRVGTVLRVAVGGGAHAVVRRVERIVKERTGPLVAEAGQQRGGPELHVAVLVGTRRLDERRRRHIDRGPPSRRETPRPARRDRSRRGCRLPARDRRPAPVREPAGPLRPAATRTPAPPPGRRGSLAGASVRSSCGGAPRAGHDPAGGTAASPVGAILSTICMYASVSRGGGTGYCLV